MKKLLLGLFLSTSALAADISTYVPITEMQNVPNYSQLSGIAKFENRAGNVGEIIVANGGGKVRFAENATDSSSYFAYGSMGGCADVEGIRMKEPGVYYLADERTGNIYVMDETARKCTDAIRTISTGIPNDSNRGLEGIAVDGNNIYLIKQTSFATRTAPVYHFVDTGQTSVTPTLLFNTSCSDGGDIEIRPNGNFLVPCDPANALQEYSPTGVLVSSLPITFDNPEGVYDDGNMVCITGEANQYRCFVTGGVVPDPDPDPTPTTEVCTVSGNVTVNSSTRVLEPNQTITVNCETPGTLTVSGELNG